MALRQYLMLVNIPFALDEQRRVRVDRLWAIDLRRHLQHEPGLVLCAPLQAGAAPDDWEIVESEAGVALAFAPMPEARGALATLLSLPLMAARLARHVSRADIVHYHSAGWPIPLGWLAAPLAKWMGKKTVLVIESAPWRGFGPVKRRIWEWAARQCVRSANLRFYTHQQYAESLAPKNAKRGQDHVLHASWVDEQHIITSASLMRRNDERLENVGRPKRIAFFGRLNCAKGVEVLLKAAEMLSPQEAAIDIYGAGELAEAIACAEPGGVVRVAGTLPYDERFFETLATYDVVVVPSLSDEQPRVVYDAFACGVPVIASDTSGLRDCIAHGETGLLVPPGDAEALANALREVPLQRLVQMGGHARDVALAFTHQHMHRRRADVVQAFFASAGDGKGHLAA